MSGGRKPTGDEVEVEALLRAAQDAVLLKIQANSHLASSSSSPASNHLALDPAPGSLDDDLARRFDALRSRPPAPKRPDAASASAAVGVDEIEAQFAALKGVAAGPEETKVRLEDLGDESEDEVDKVMRWAMDTARLDVATAGGGVTPTPSTEEKEEIDRSSASSKEDDEEVSLELKMDKKRKEKEMMSKKNKAKNRWFFF